MLLGRTPPRQRVKPSIRTELALWLRKCRRDPKPNLWRFLFEIAAPLLIIFFGILLLATFVALIYQNQP